MRNFELPTTAKERLEARNKSETCRHFKKTMFVVSRNPEPSSEDSGRVREQLFCHTCGALKVDWVGSNGLRKPAKWKQESEWF